MRRVQGVDAVEHAECGTRQFKQLARSATDFAVTKTNRIKDLRPLVPQILEALARLTPGELIRIGS